MKTLKGWITPSFLAVTLMASTMNVNAGIILGGGNATQEPCSSPTAKEENIDYGIVLGGLTGIVLGGFTGIIIGSGVTNTPTTDCGIIIGGL